MGRRAINPCLYRDRNFLSEEVISVQEQIKIVAVGSQRAADVHHRVVSS